MMNAARVRLLLVDDQESVRETTAALLSDDFEVVCAPDGMSALEIILTDQTFEIICADYNMPGMSGAELLRRAQSLRPCAAVLVTGHSDYVDAIPHHMRQGVAVVLKPYEPQMLIDTAHRAYMLLKASGMSKQQRKLS